MGLQLSIDLGTSFVKVAVVNIETGKRVCAVQYPDTEMEIISSQPGWAEQDTLAWWENVCAAILKAHATDTYDPKDINAIGIAYQMHGLIVIDWEQKVLRPAIIWCDSRATDKKKYPFGNFAAGKLAWIKNNEPEIYKQIDKILLPGDYISMKLTGEVSTTISALSEGMFVDLKTRELNEEVFAFHGFDKSLIPEIKPVFSDHGKISADTAKKLGLNNDVQVNFKAGDQIANAFSLNVMEPGEVAATAGTSGVIYVISEQPFQDTKNRVNSFIHVTGKTGVLLCINGCGSAYSWLQKNVTPQFSYPQMNEEATKAKLGSEGLLFYPFGNGAERMLENKNIGAGFENLDFNRHGSAHMIRAVLEGIAYSFRYGLDILRENGISPRVIRAHHTNLFLSGLFVQILASVTNTILEVGNAMTRPQQFDTYNEHYTLWKQELSRKL